jgi:hypothetical protein
MNFILTVRALIFGRPRAGRRVRRASASH